MINNEKLLSSWKEIASYLKCGIRTCRRWELNYDLPIHRISGTGKTTVYADKDELDTWLKKRKENNEIAIHKRSSLKRVFLILFSLVLGSSFLFLHLKESPQPSNFKIIRSKLIILDERGDEIWSYDTEVENLIELDMYKEHWQTRKKHLFVERRSVTYLPFIIFKDINNDNKIEVLFCAVTKNLYGGGRLFCFDHKGNLLWDRITGRKMNFGTEIFSDFSFRGILAEDLDGDSHLEIITISNAILRYPTQLCILNSDGNVIGEFWNSGQLNDICLTDITKDGKKDLLVAGINNEYRKGCLIVFTSLELKGGSPQKDKKYICSELGKGSFLYYILFSRTDVDLNEYIVESVSSIEIDSNSNFHITMERSQLIFLMDSSFVINDIIKSHRFLNKHRILKEENKINSTLDDNYWYDLLRDILYWDGQKWVSTPIMNSSGSS